MKRTNLFKSMQTNALGWLLLVSATALALPEGMEINGGSGHFTQPHQNLLNVHQYSEKLSINFSGFDIGQQETVNFIQPSADAIALGRVVGGGVSDIQGALNANGQLFLINPAGVIFGEQAQVDVGGLVVSTLELSDQDFFAGHYQFTQNNNLAPVINNGELRAGSGGYIALLADQVINNGNILADKGSVQLTSGAQVQLSFVEGSDLNVSVDQATYQAYVENNGVIQAPGGVVVMNANAADALLTTVVNNTGVVEANGIETQGGRIFLNASGQGDVINSGTLTANGTQAGQIELSGDRVAQLGTLQANHGGDIHLQAEQTLVLGEQSQTQANGGAIGDGGRVIAYTPGTAIFRQGATISATGGEQQGNGGFVEVSGLEQVEIQGQVNTSAAQGASGTFLIDPNNITITNADNNTNNVGGVFTPTASGSTIDVATLQANLSTGNVRVETTSPGTEAGDITIATDLDLDGSNGNELTLQADGSLLVNATIADQNTATVDNTDLVMIVGGNLNVSDGQRIDVGGGTVTATVGGLANITGIQTTSAADAAVQITAAEISDNGDSNLDINANNGGIQLNTSAANLTGLEIAVDRLNVSTGANGQLDLTEQDDINLQTLAFITDLTLSAGGTVQLDDAGLSITDRIEITAADMVDSNRTVNINSQDLLLTLTQAGGDLTLNTNVDRLDIDITAAGGISSTLTVNEANGLSVQDMNADSNALVVNQGNIALTVNNGDLRIHNNLTASDTQADGVRQGLIDIALASGDLNIGTTGSAAIQSINTVEQNLAGGLGNLPSNQVAIRIQHQDTSGQSHAFNFGNNSGNDVLISAQGGDLLIDSFNNANLTLGSVRPITIGSDVQISAYNQLTDPATGTVISGDLPVGNQVQARAGRTVQIRQDLTLAVDDPDITIEIDDELADAVNKDDTGNTPDNKVTASQSDVQNLFQAQLAACNTNEQQSTDCVKNRLMVQFLESLLIGGDLPEESPK